MLMRTFRLKSPAISTMTYCTPINIVRAGEIVGWVDEDTPVFACGDETLVAIPELVSEGQSFRAGDVLVAGTGRPVLR